MELNEENSSNINDHNSNPSHLEDLKSISSLFKKRFLLYSKAVVSNRIWLQSETNTKCDVLITFKENIRFEHLKILLELILEANLIVNIKYHLTTREICFYITATYERLLIGAEYLQLRKPVKNNYGGGVKEFIFEEQEFYKNIENELIFLTTQEKQSIILDILYQIKKDHEVKIGSLVIKPNQKIVFWCWHKNFISHIMAVHDHDGLTELRNKWVKSTRNQPLDKINSYFGVKLALYFAWLGYYTKALVIPAILGLLFWIYSKKNEPLDAMFFLFLSAFNLIWGACFNKLWKQRSAEYAYKWGCLDIEQNYLQEPRPLFKGKNKISKVTNKLEPHYADWKRTIFRYFLTFPCLGLNIIATIILMLVMFKIQEYARYLTDIHFLPNPFGLTLFLPKVLYANITSFLNHTYRTVCIWLNDKENYREETTYENQLITKIVAFQFINSYLSLFYIAFYLQNYQLLQEHLFAIFITKSIITGNIKESILPYISQSLKQIKLIGTTKKENYIAPSDEFKKELNNLQKIARTHNKKLTEVNNIQNDDAGSKNDAISNSNSDLFDDKKRTNSFLNIADITSLSQPEVESIMPNNPDTFGDYLEMVIQYGLLEFFAPVFPLASLCALINNIIEIRSDAFKMCYLFQRPFGQRVGDIGKWEDVIEIFTTLGIISNCILLFTSGTMNKLLPSLGNLEIIVIVIIIEHLSLAFNKFLTLTIPKLPKWIIIEKCKLEFKRREALKQIELNDLKKAKVA